MPRTPLYRAIPQLDRYSDEFCRLLVNRLVRRWSAVYVARAVVNVVGAALIGSAAGLIVMPMVLAFLYPDDLGHVLPEDRVRFVSLLGGLAAFGLSYRAMERGSVLRMLRRAMHPRFIDGERCIACGYTLAGLKGEDLRVVCPECGRRVPFGQGAVTPIDEMIARGELPDPHPGAMGGGSG